MPNPQVSGQNYPVRRLTDDDVHGRSLTVECPPTSGSMAAMCATLGIPRRTALLSELPFEADALMCCRRRMAEKPGLSRRDFYSRPVRSSASRSPVDGAPVSEDALVFWRAAGETCSNAVLRQVVTALLLEMNTCCRSVNTCEHLPSKAT